MLAPMYQHSYVHSRMQPSWIFLCQYVKPLLNSIYCICGFGQWFVFSQIRISEYKQWIMFLWHLYLVSGDSVFFGLGGILSCSSSTCALCFFLSPITLELRNIEWERVPQKLTQNIHDCASDTCVLVIRTLTLPVSLHSFH